MELLGVKMVEIQSTHSNGVMPGMNNQGPTCCQSCPAPRVDTLASAKASNPCGQILSWVVWPFTLIGQCFFAIGSFLKKAICCCCGAGRDDEKIDWAKTKDAFAKVKAALEADEAHRPKSFLIALGGLSKAAQKRFIFYVGLAHAQLKEGKNERAEQEKWLSDNKGGLVVRRDYYINLSDARALQVLNRAAENFEAEIKRNL